MVVGFSHCSSHSRFRVGGSDTLVHSGNSFQAAALTRTRQERREKKRENEYP